MLGGMQRISAPSFIPEKPVFHGVAITNPGRLPGYRRNLPHIRFLGATYFVTFRLADSIPLSVASAWRIEREAWMRSKGIEPSWAQTAPTRFRNALNALSFTERQEESREYHRRFFCELDRCHGCCALARAGAVVSRALEFFDAKRVWIGDYVVMPNHVHVLVQPYAGVKLEEWLYSVKRFTSRQIQADARLELPDAMRRGVLWQPESFDRIVRDVDELCRFRCYIQNNPVNLRPGTFVYRRMSWLDAV